MYSIYYRNGNYEKHPKMPLRSQAPMNAKMDAQWCKCYFNLTSNYNTYQQCSIRIACKSAISTYHRSTIQVTAKLLELRFCQHLKGSPLKMSRFRNPTLASTVGTPQWSQVFQTCYVCGSQGVWVACCAMVCHGLPEEREVHLHLHHTVGYGIHDDSWYKFLVYIHAGLGMFAIFGRMTIRL